MNNNNIDYLYNEMSKPNQKHIKDVICEDMGLSFGTVSNWFKTSGTGVPNVRKKRVNELLQNWHRVNTKKLEKHL